MSKKDDKKKQAKPKKEKQELPADVLTLARHAKARSAIKTVRSYAGLITFALVTLLSLRAHVPIFDAWLRGLGAGIAAVIVAWGISLSVWRHLALAEIEEARTRLMSSPPTSTDR